MAAAAVLASTGALAVTLVRAVAVPALARRWAARLAEVAAALSMHAALPPEPAGRPADDEQPPRARDDPGSLRGAAGDEAETSSSDARRRGTDRGARPSSRRRMSASGLPAGAPAPADRGKQGAGESRSLFVDRSTVESLLRARVNPAGRSVPASAAHPAGIEVTDPDGLSRLLHRGDVIVDVDGRSTPTIEDLIGAVGAAQQKRAARVSGHIVRDGERWSVIVEAPW